MQVGRSGFSLLELLVVTAMISMICGLGILRLGDSLAEYELSAAALELAADLRWMQQVSVNSPSSAGGAFYLLTFDKGSGTGYLVTAAAKNKKRVQFPASVQLANNPLKISFNSNGNPSNAQTIALKSLRLKKTRFVIIAAVTGRVRISEVATWETGE